MDPDELKVKPDSETIDNENEADDNETQQEQVPTNEADDSQGKKTTDDIDSNNLANKSAGVKQDLDDIRSDPETNETTTTANDTNPDPTESAPQPATPAPGLNDETISKREELKKSGFIAMVARSSNLPDGKPTNNLISGLAHNAEMLGTTAAGGLAAKGVYDAALGSQSEKKLWSPTEKAAGAQAKPGEVGQNPGVFSMIGSVLGGVVLVGLAVIKLASAGMSNGAKGIGTTLVDAGPAVLTGICGIMDSVFGCLQINKENKTALNILAVLESFFTILELAITVIKASNRKKHIKKMLANFTDQKERDAKTLSFQPINDDLTTLTKFSMAKIVANGADCIAKLVAAITFAKNSNGKVAMAGKIATGITGAVKNSVNFGLGYGRAKKEGERNTQGHADELHSALSNEITTDFTSLYSDGSLFINVPDNALPEEQAATATEPSIEKYFNVYEQMQSINLTVHSMATADSKTKQKELISDAVGF